MQIPRRYKFIIQLGKALHTYGVPSYKSQIYLTQVAKQKDIRGSFMDTPTWINYSFYQDDDQSYNYVECVPPGELNLGALSKIDEITNNVLEKKLSFAEAKDLIEQMDKKKFKTFDIIQLLSFMVSAGSFCIILDTNWVSSIVATFLGAVVYGFTVLSKKSRYVQSTLESMVAFSSTIIVGLLSQVIPNINISMTILASIIVFIPGLAITTALEEITSKSLVSGTAKLFDALVSLFKQFFGVVLGLAILPLFMEIKQMPIVNDVPQWVDYFAIIGLTGSLLPVFRVRRKDLFFGVVTGFVSFYVTYLLGFTGILVSIFVGTISVVLISRLFARINKSPELVFLTPGIIMLVPGSKAFIGLSTVFLASDAVNTTNMGEQVFFIFMGIIGGLIFSGTFKIAK